MNLSILHQLLLYTLPIFGRFNVKSLLKILNVKLMSLNNEWLTEWMNDIERYSKLCWMMKNNMKKISENENQNNNNTHKIAKRSPFESFSQPFIIQHLMVIYQNMSNSSHRFNGQKIWMNGGLPSHLLPPLSSTRSFVRSFVRPTLLSYIFFLSFLVGSSCSH